MVVDFRWMSIGILAIPGFWALISEPDTKHDEQQIAESLVH
jgi:hypothetical protein